MKLEFLVLVCLICTLYVRIFRLGKKIRVSFKIQYSAVTESATAERRETTQNCIFRYCIGKVSVRAVNVPSKSFYAPWNGFERCRASVSSSIAKVVNNHCFEGVEFPSKLHPQEDDDVAFRAAAMPHIFALLHLLCLVFINLIHSHKRTPTRFRQ